MVRLVSIACRIHLHGSFNKHWPPIIQQIGQCPLLGPIKLSSTLCVRQLLSRASTSAEDLYYREEQHRGNAYIHMRGANHSAHHLLALILSDFRRNAAGKSLRSGKACMLPWVCALQCSA